MAYRVTMLGVDGVVIYDGGTTDTSVRHTFNDAVISSGIAHVFGGALYGAERFLMPVSKVEIKCDEGEQAFGLEAYTTRLNTLLMQAIAPPDKTEP